MKTKGLIYGLVFVLILFLSIGVIGEGDALADWNIECVDCPKIIQYSSSRTIAIDSLNRPHIAYGGDHLYYAYYNGIQWQYETVDNSPMVGSYSSIAIDSNNKVHISYFDNINDTIKYSTNASGVWVTSTIDSTGNVGDRTSIAIDSNNKVHISYAGAGGLNYATNASGVWVISTIGPGSGSSIAIDSNNRVHISYTGNGLNYATNASGVWVTSTIDSDSAGYVGTVTSIAIDSNNKVHISYFYLYDDPYGNWSYLKYATNASGSWVVTALEYFDNAYGGGSWNSIAIDSNNKVHISYYDDPNWDLKYATNASGVWVTSTIDSAGNVGDCTSIAIDSNNNVHISYYDSYPDYNVKYTTNASGSWVTTTVDSYGSVGAYTSIAIDSNNNVHISYFEDDPDYNLMYATNDSGSWVTSSVDSEMVSGSSIAIDSNNNVHISYSAGGYPRLLKYATNASGAWVTSTISSGEDAVHPSITIDSNNKVHISYYDTVNKNLKYATNVSGSWVTTTVDSAGDVGLYPSIAIDSNNNVHISYYDRIAYAYNGKIKYATNSSGAWVITTIDSAGYVTFTSTTKDTIAIDSNNNVHIVYDTFDTGILKYATNSSGSWVITSTGVASSSSSIAIDSNNKVHISCMVLNGSINATSIYYLKYVTNSSGSWSIDTIDSTGIVGSYNSLALDSNNNVHISYYDIANNDLKYATNTPMDNDGDGYASDVDCDDNDPLVNPGMSEVRGNGKDDDCNPATSDYNVDLYVSSVTAPGSASPGGTISVGATVNKSGSGSASASTARIYIYGQLLGTATNYFKKLGDVAVSAFGAGPGSEAISATVTIPVWVVAGSHQIIVRADLNNDVPEWNERNNRREVAITIVP